MVPAAPGLDVVAAAAAQGIPDARGLAAELTAAIPALPQPEATDLGLGDIDVVGAGEQALAPHEAEAVVDDVEDAAGEDGAVALGLGFLSGRQGAVVLHNVLAH